jgi:hypothetical protein
MCMPPIIATHSPAKPRFSMGLQRKKPYWPVAVMNFSDYFYLAGNMCLVAQQNMFLSWGRITLSL